MKKISFLFLILITFQGFSQSFDQQKMDSLFNYLSQKNQIMGSLAIFENGKKTYTKSFGYADVETQQKANAQTLYRIGSISKTFTATIIMQLVEEGKLKLDTKLAKFYPQLPNASKITVEELLDHHSGLFNFTNKQDYTTWMQTPQTKGELLAKFKENGTDFEPGEKGEYSNTNYVLLSFIAEDVTGKTFEKIFQNRIVKPLQLKRTRFGGKINPKNNEALSYAFGENGWKPLPETAMSIPMGAGAVVSTASEVSRFYSALFNGKLVNDTSLKNMENQRDGFGFGIVSPPYRDKTNFAHGGAIDGFQAFAVYFPKENVSITLCTNASQMSLNTIMLGTFDIYFGYDYDFPKFETITNAKDYEGTYTSGSFPLDLKIFSKDGQLYGQGTGQSAFPLTKKSKNTFVFEMAGLEIKFFPEKDSLKFTQNGTSHDLKRKEE